MTELVQLNVRVPKKLANKIRGDARRHSRTLDSVATTILEDFFKSWSLKDRANYYAKSRAKTVGRKVSAKV